MRVVNFEGFWKEELKEIIKWTQDPFVIQCLYNLSKKTWEQCRYTNDNTKRY